MEQQTFLQKNKVILTGLLMAVLTALAPVIMGDTSKGYDYKLIIIAVAMAAAGYFGNDKRGQAWSMGGTVSSALLAFSSSYEQNLDWPKVIFSVVFALLGIAIPPPKLETYEKSAPIVEAKAEAVVLEKESKEQPKP